MERFEASVQYGDWDGTAAADDADGTTILKYLRDKGEVGEDDFLLATSIWVGENHSGTIGTVFIQAFVFEGKRRYEEVRAALQALGDEPVPVREVRIEMSIEQYIVLFKRFDVVLTWRDFRLQGREYRVINR